MYQSKTPSSLSMRSSRMGVGNRERVLDDPLGLACARYAHILLALTEASGPPSERPEA